MIPTRLNTRRNFLRGTLLATGAAMLGLPALPRLALAQDSPARSPSLITTEQFRQRLRGPIFSLPTPFTADFDIDHKAIGRMVGRAIDHGIGIFTLTAGNSLFDLLTYDEIKQVNRTLVEAVGDGGLKIAATNDWWTGQAVDFARYIDTLDADALQVRIPTRSGGEDAIVEHYQQIARNTRLPIVLHGNFSESLLEKLLKIDSIAAMKEDITLDYYIDRQVAFGERIEIFGGGAEHRFLVGQPYGSRAYYSTYSTFAPDIAMQFWKHIQADDQKAAVAHTLKHEYPFIKRFSHPFWRGTLEHFGLAQRHLRPPMTGLHDQQMADLRTFFEEQGLTRSDTRGESTDPQMR
jgi:dihydrodipicolinate synthase/N-acetylneuraminate lyase